MATKGKCFRCSDKISPNAVGYCNSCFEKVFDERTEEFPWVIDIDGYEEEEFKTEEEANDRLESLWGAYVRKRR